MIIAHERSAIYSNVLKNIYGVAFLGTPHRGSDLAWWANFPATLVKSLQLGRGTNKAYVEALKRNSEEFSDISRQWVERAMELRIRTYYETERLLGFLVSTRAFPLLPRLSPFRTFGEISVLYPV